MSNQTFVKSTLILTIATLVSKILGSIFRIPLQNIAGDAVLGIFSFTYPVYMVALTLSVAGIPVAISKLISEARAKNDKSSIRDIFVTAGILGLLFGVVSFSVIYAFSAPIAEMLGGPSRELALIIVSTTLFIAPYMAVYRGFYQGFEDMRPTAISQVLEQFIRVALILGVAYVLVKQGRSVEVVAGGVMAGSSIGALVSLLYLRRLFVKSPVRPKAADAFTFAKFKKTSATILKISLPICVGAITMALLNLVDSLTIPNSLKTHGYSNAEIDVLSGIYGRGLTLVQIATVVSTSIILPLIPLITGALTRGEHEKARSAVVNAHSLTHFVSWPAAFGLIALTLPVNLGLFTDLKGSMVLAIISFSSLFTSLTVLGTGVLQGMDKAKLAAWIIIAGVAIKLVLNIVLIGRFELEGAAWATTIIYILLFAANTFFIYRTIRFSIFNRQTFVFAFSSLVMGAVIGIPTLFLPVESWSRSMAVLYTGAAIIIGGAIYALLVLAMKGLDQSMLASFPVIGKYFNKEKAVRPQKPMNMKVKERKGNVKKWLAIVLAVSLLLTIPSIIERSKAEWRNNTYEFIIPYNDIQDLLNEKPEMDREELLGTLKEAGLQSVSLEPETLAKLVNKGTINVLTTKEMRNALLLMDMQEGASNKEGVYVYAENDPYFKERIIETFDRPERVILGEKPFYFIPGNSGRIQEMPITFNPEVMKDIEAAGLEVVLRVADQKLEKDNQRMVDELLRWKDDKIHRILYSGESVLGNSDRPNMTKWTQQLHNAGYEAFSIEFADQKGMNTVSYLMDSDVIRLHSIDLGDKPHRENVDKVVRAVKERNIKAIFTKMPLKKVEDPDLVLEQTVNFLEDAQAKMPGLFHDGISVPFEKVEIPLWQKAFGLLAAVAFAGLAALAVTRNRLIMWIAIAGMGAASLLYIVTGMGLLLKAVALAIAIAAPVYAVVPKREVRSKVDILREYAFAALIAFLGIWIVVVLLNGTQFLVKADAFRGVKLLYSVPIAFMLVYALWGAIRTVLKQEIKYWHLAILFVVAAAGLYYISRTGNEGSVSSIELTIRQTLENMMYVRPRTKEFLIGFPFYVLALYVSMRYKKAALFLLVPSVIGYLSMVNTFTHLHIPLYVSALRSVFGLIIGLLVGVIFIYVYKLALRGYEVAKARWIK